jgi:hypothetical protein
MKLLQAYIISILVFCMSNPIEAVDSDGKWHVKGIGVDTCGEYVGAEIMEKRWFEHWMMGYISGLNHFKHGRPDFSAGVSPKSLTLWVKKYCDENPLANFSDAIDLLIEETSKK